MASATGSRQCVKCKDNIGSFNCEGCKEIFCTKHCIEHRQELSNQFEQLMTEHNDIIQQIQEKEPQNESSKTNLLDRIDQWENTMIKKVHERAEQVRQQIPELINNENKLVVDNMQVLRDEISRRYEKEDFLEHDIERMRERINQIQIEINQSIQLSDIKLYVEPEDKIDWGRLICIKVKLPTTSSSAINKQSTDQHTKGIENTINSNVPSNFVPYRSPYDFPPPNMYYSAFRPPTNGNNTNIIYPQYVPPMPIPYSSSSSTEKRQKKTLKIVDPVSNESPELMISTLSTNPNPDLLQANLTNTRASSSSSNPSSATNNTQRKTEFQHQFIDLEGDNSKK